MRSLVRPTLFAVARLGLFLAVAGWIVGQWRCVGMNVSVSGTYVSVGICSDGWFVFRSLFPSRPFNPMDGIDFSTQPTENDSFSNEISVMRYLAGEESANSMSIPGIEYCTFGEYFAVILRHWLIVAILILSFGALRLSYRRKPPSEVPASPVAPHTPPA